MRHSNSINHQADIQVNFIISITRAIRPRAKAGVKIKNIIIFAIVQETRSIFGRYSSILCSTTPSIARHSLDSDSKSFRDTIADRFRVGRVVVGPMSVWVSVRGPEDPNRAVDYRVHERDTGPVARHA